VYPLVVTLTKQEPTRRHASSSSSSSSCDVVSVPLGTVEVDLSSLVMVGAGGTRPGCRYEQYGLLVTGQRCSIFLAFASACDAMICDCHDLHGNDVILAYGKPV
jgi:hypothetical protein